ncbi:sigma-70 family RNA polymerase sigma factor [Streptomyces albidoflavus]|uniref:RNA polymerase sigma factor n=1 Tax=Streptomyces albidoflavus TaxID=1886 RepID=UPI00068C4C18|nr:sigma-70 family RNA polymerase sigma factor [Streptomyces albidoflavus]
MMMTERGSVAPAAGGAVLADFDAILAGRVQATGFNADTGCLGVGVPRQPGYEAALVCPDADRGGQREAAVRIFRKWEIVSAHPNPVALARDIVRKSCASHYRKIAAEERRVARYVRTLGQPVTTADDILALRGMERLDRAWAALEERAPRQAECVRLRYTEEMSKAEISVELGITVNAVKSSVHLGLASLRKQLAPSPVDLMVIDGAGHYEMYDEPEYVDAAVERLTSFYANNL